MTPGLRSALLEAVCELDARNLSPGTSGNLSARTPGGFLITPSGLAAGLMQTADLVEVSLAGEWPRSRRPSSEWRFHRDIYRHFPEASAVVHAHPPFCVALASHRRGIPAFHYSVALAGGADIRCADYATFGTQALSDNVLSALEGRRACLMANHGMVCFADNPAKALSLALEVEHLARSYVHALSLGEPVVLDGDEMDRVLGQFDDYRAGRLTARQRGK
ncbi:class II aldolase/adducin family protein [Elongatibacter sediminis]|uniref:Class II aldolase/adducin family protein n=1 Tax=Elongatibacter sediminis TaxID=3119006 RepID=A0AAW9RA98_9GAMM